VVSPLPVPPAQRSARIAAVFDRVADTYDNIGVAWFTPIAQRLVRQAAAAPGERAVDFGCGRGAALFALAEAVGPAGSVTGIDLSPRMVAATRAGIQVRGLAHVDVRVMDASTPRLLPGGYDLAVASFVLFFLPAPVAALRAWRDLLVPGGRLAISSFAESGAGWLDDVFRPHLRPSVFGAGRGPASAFDTDAGVERLLTAAGYGAVRTTGFELDVVFTDAHQWQAWSYSHGQRAIWDRIPLADHDLVRAAAAERLDRSRGADGTIRLTQRIRFTLAERPR
jgi:ubiquinone/menaquinone biosynthesis C-methylase UbiE